MLLMSWAPLTKPLAVAVALAVEMFATLQFRAAVKVSVATFVSAPA
jgi:hypothetical protein